MQKENYFNDLEKNYFPVDNKSNDIQNIKEYLDTDSDNEAYTDENGAAIYNDTGKKLLEDNGWDIEPADTFHEENGKAVVKLIHENGGEQVYDLETGDIIDNQEYGGTFNTGPGPYGFKTLEKISNSLSHTGDINFWKRFGGGPNDPSTVAERKARSKGTAANPYGSKHRHLKPIEIKMDGNNDIIGL